MRVYNPIKKRRRKTFVTTEFLMTDDPFKYAQIWNAVFAGAQLHYDHAWHRASSSIVCAVDHIP